jgi:plastocyanin
MMSARLRWFPWWLVTAAVVTGSLVVGCGSPRDNQRTVQEASPGSTGVLEGLVTWTGTVIPTPTLVENTTDPQVCGRKQTLADVAVSSRSRGVENVIVALTDVPADKIPPLASARLVLDNQQCTFFPHVSVLTTGSVIEATNSDPILHTTHLYGPLEANIALPLKGQRVARTVDKPGTIVVKCDVHGWMQGFVRVDPHPFHAVSADSGAFRISGIPPGTYTLEAWHEKLGTRHIRVQVRSGATERVALEYSPTQP